MPLDNWLEEDILQGIATENNLSETAFFVQRKNLYHLRWFTPTEEVTLCGHATLAAAYIPFKELAVGKTTVGFETLSGRLNVAKDGDLLTLDFPSYEPHGCAAPEALIRGLGREPDAMLKTDIDPLCVDSLLVQPNKKNPPDGAPAFRAWR